MRTSEIDILIVPGDGSHGSDHWLCRWERNLKTARRVDPADWGRLDAGDWADRIAAAAVRAVRPVVLVGHGAGAVAIAHAAPRLPAGVAVGAFLVAPVDVARSDGHAGRRPHLGVPPTEPLPFRSKLIGSSNDVHCSVARAEAIGRAWGSDVSIVADGGHLDVESGHGPWPEGLLTFGLFLKSLG